MATIFSDANTIRPQFDGGWYFAYNAGNRTSAGRWFHRTRDSAIPKKQVAHYACRDRGLVEPFNGRKRAKLSGPQGPRDR